MLKLYPILKSALRLLYLTCLLSQPAFPVSEYQHCRDVIKNIMWMDFAEDIRPRMAEVAKGLLASHHPDSIELVGMPAFLIMRSAGISYQNAKFFALTKIQEEINQIQKDSHYATKTYRAVRQFINKPAPTPLVSSNFIARWRLNETARELFPLALDATPPRFKLETRPFAFYKLANSLGATSYASHILELMLLRGDYTGVLTAAAESRKDNTVINVALELLGDYFRNGLEEPVAKPYLALHGLSLIAERNEMARQILKELAIEVLSPEFKTAQLIKSRALDGSTEALKFTSDTYGVGLLAAYYSGTKAGIRLYRTGMISWKFSITDPALIGITAEVLSKMPDDAILKHADLIVDMSRALKKPYLIRNLYRILGKLRDPIKAAKYTLLRAEIAYTQRQVKSARHYLLHYLNKEDVNNDNAQTKLNRAVAIASYYEDPEGISTLHEWLHKNISSVESAEDCYNLRYLTNSADAISFVDLYHPGFSLPKALHPLLQLSQSWDYWSSFALEKKEGLEKEAEIPSGERVEKKYQYSDQFSKFILTQPRAAAIQIGDSFANRGEKYYFNAFLAYFYASTMVE